MTTKREHLKSHDGRRAHHPSRLRAMLEHIGAIPGGPQLLLRLFLGVTFTFAGLQKLANPSFFNAQAPGSFQAQLHGAMLTSPIHALLSAVGHAPVLIGVLIACGEVAVGIGTLLGLFGRIAAFGGILLSLSFFLTISYSTSPYYYGSDIVFVFAWTPLILGGAGSISIDGLLFRKFEEDESALPDNASRAEIDRRSIVRQISALGIVGLFVGALAGLATGIGRSRNHSAAAATNTSNDPLGTSAVTSNTTTGTAPHSTSPSAGRKIAAAASVPVGGAQSFTDPFQQIPAYVLQPTSGVFLAFSAVCTHAGCTVGFDGSANEFVCPCHGSIYNARTGAVLRGPAQNPLPSIEVRETNGTIYAED